MSLFTAEERRPAESLGALAHRNPCSPKRRARLASRPAAAAEAALHEDAVLYALDHRHGPGIARPSAHEIAHVFACFFQVRRAFHHTFWHIPGGSPPAAALRAAREAGLPEPQFTLAGGFVVTLGRRPEEAFEAVAAEVSPEVRLLAVPVGPMTRRAQLTRPAAAPYSRGA